MTAKTSAMCCRLEKVGTQVVRSSVVSCFYYQVGFFSKWQIVPRRSAIEFLGQKFYFGVNSVKRVIMITVSEVFSSLQTQIDSFLACFSVTNFTTQLFAFVLTYPLIAYLLFRHLSIPKRKIFRSSLPILISKYPLLFQT